MEWAANPPSSQLLMLRMIMETNLDKQVTNHANIVLTPSPIVCMSPLINDKNSIITRILSDLGHWFVLGLNCWIMEINSERSKVFKFSDGFFCNYCQRKILRVTEPGLKGWTISISHGKKVLAKCTNTNCMVISKVC